MEIPWLLIGYESARLIITVILTIVVGGKIYARYIQPELVEALGDAQKAVKNLASLAGIKSQEYSSSKSIEKSVARDIIEKQIPELELVKTFVSPATWDEINDTLENNPEAVIQLWEKYGHLFKGVQQQELDTDF